MAQLLIIILDDLKRLPALLQAWQSIGVPGVTILESAGAFRATTWLDRVGLGMLDRLFESDEVRRRTLLVALEDDQLLARAIAEAEQVMGDFDRPNSGLLFSLPITEVRGLRKIQPKLVAPSPPPLGQPDWMARRDTPVEVIADNLKLTPTLVRPDALLDEVAQAMLANPNVHVSCVTADDSRLLGLIDLETLTDDLFLHIIPEEALSEITDLEHVIEFAQKSQARTAADAMQPPVWVKRGETVKDAFKRMHERHLSGLPLVDELYHVVGYINLFGLLAVCLQPENNTGVGS